MVKGNENAIFNFDSEIQKAIKIVNCFKFTLKWTLT